MKPRHQYEWEIRGVQLIRGKATNCHLGVEQAETDSEAITRWIKGRGRFVKASCLSALPAHDLTQFSRRNSAVAAVLTLLGSTLLTEGPAWGVSFGNTLGIHTPTLPALVGEGAILGAHGQGYGRSIHTHNGGDACQSVDVGVWSQLRVGGEWCASIESPAVGGKRPDLRARRGLREQTGYRMAVPACTGLTMNRQSDESRLSDKAGGSPATHLNIFTGQFRGVAPWEDTDAVNTKCANARRITASVEASSLNRSVRAQTLNGQTVGPERPTPLSQHTRSNAVLEDGHDRRGSSLRPGVLGSFLSTVDVGNTHTASEAPVRKPPGYPARVGGPSQDGTHRSYDSTPMGKLADGGQSFRTILGVLSVVTCGMAGFLVLTCVAMGGEK